jgi:hypothetical protein
VRVEMKKIEKSKFLKFMDWMEEIIDMKGGTWVGLFSVTYLYRLMATKPVTSEEVALYGVVLGAFTIHRTVKAAKAGQGE